MILPGIMRSGRWWMMARGKEENEIPSWIVWIQPARRYRSVICDKDPCCSILVFASVPKKIAVQSRWGLSISTIPGFDWVRSKMLGAFRRRAKIWFAFDRPRSVLDATVAQRSDARAIKPLVHNLCVFLIITSRCNHADQINLFQH